MQRIAHAAGKETRIQNGARRHGQAHPGGMLEKQGADQGKRRDKEELTAGQLHAVHHGDKVIHQKDLCCKHKGAQHHAEVAGGDGKALRDAQAVQSRHRQQHTDPHRLGYSLLQENAEKVTAMRNRLIDGLKGIERSRINGDLEHHLPGTLNMCFEGIEGESLLLLLDAKGICASSGSACTSGSLDPSHVLLSIGVPVEIAHGSLRLSISEYNTMEQMDHIVKSVPEVVSYLRSISPVWERIKKEEK